MRRTWLVALATAILLVGCGGDDDQRAAPSTTSSSPARSTTTTTAADGTCPDTYPPFGTTWLPTEWRDQYLVAGSGGDDAQQCGVYHWGGSGRYVDVRVGDGGQSFGEGTRTITVLGRRAPIGAIHEGFMVRTDTHALLAYGVTEDELQRVAEGLYPTPRGSFAEARLPGDGIAPAKVVAVGERSITVDPIAWYVGDEARRALVQHGFSEDDLANDYYAPNDDATTQTVPVATDVVVTSPWAHYGSDGCELCQRVITYAELRDLFTGAQPDPPRGNSRGDPFWITVVDGAVTRIDEQYVP